MSGRPQRETIMSALFAQLVASVVTNFTGDLAVGSPIILNPSQVQGLFFGLPVFGAGFSDEAATILSLGQSTPITVSGTITPGDVLTITASGAIVGLDNVSRPFSQSASATVLTGSTLATLAAALAAAILAAGTLAADGFSASATGDVVACYAPSNANANWSVSVAPTAATEILTVGSPVSAVLVGENASAAGIGVALSTGFRTTGRRALMWSEVQEQPALFLRNGTGGGLTSGDEYRYIATMALQQVEIEAEIWIYSDAGRDSETAPGIPLNNLIDAVEDVFEPDDPSTNRFTLGGLVSWCRIEGRSELDPGDIDGQAKAVLPVKILIP